MCPWWPLGSLWQPLVPLGDFRGHHLPIFCPNYASGYIGVSTSSNRFYRGRPGRPPQRAASPCFRRHLVQMGRTRHPGAVPELQLLTPSGDGRASCHGKTWIHCRKSENLRGELDMRKSDLVRQIGKLYPSLRHDAERVTRD